MAKTGAILALDMAAIISMLRGVNVGGNRLIKMEALKALYLSLGLLDVQTYIQSGNVIFSTKEKNLGSLTRKIETGIEQTFGFHSDTVLRTTFDLRDVIAKNPFGSRPGIHPGKLLVVFLARNPTAEALDKVLTIETGPEELRIGELRSGERELYIYFPNGQARPKLSLAQVERALKVSWTGRNLNTTMKLLELAEKLEASR